MKEFSKVGKVTTESVFKYTGRHWEEWIPLLEKAGARTWKYQEIVAFLRKKHKKLTPWWQHGVAMGFEIATGRRLEGQDMKGAYMVTATKSLAKGVQPVWKALLSDKGQEAWLKPLYKVSLKAKAQFETMDGFFGEVRTLANARRLRMFWQDPLWEKHTVVEVMLVPRPGGKSILVFNHTGIRDIKTRNTLRVRWREAADRIPGLLEK